MRTCDQIRNPYDVGPPDLEPDFTTDEDLDLESLDESMSDDEYRRMA